MPAEWGSVKRNIVSTMTEHPNWSVYQIADEIGSSAQTVKTISYRLGFNPPQRRKKKIRWTRADLSMLKGYISAGRSMGNICLEMGIYKMALTDGLFLLASEGKTV